MIVNDMGLCTGIGVLLWKSKETFKITDEIKFWGVFFVMILKRQLALVWFVGVRIYNLLRMVHKASRNVLIEHSLFRKYIKTTITYKAGTFILRSTTQ